MNEAKSTKSPNFLRDQFILTAILVVALICRSSLVSSPKPQTELAKQPASVSVGSEKIADAR